MNLRLFGSLLLVLVIFFVSVPATKTEARGDNQSNNVKGTNETGCIEVIEAKAEGQSCTTAQGISLRLKVNCDAAADVRIYYKNKRDKWEGVTFKNKSKGEEVTFANCFGFAPYKIFKRDAGSTKDFPNP